MIARSSTWEKQSTRKGGADLKASRSFAACVVVPAAYLRVLVAMLAAGSSMAMR